MVKRVFIVDDDNMYRKVLEQQFVDTSHEVLTFATGEDCLKSTTMPDILLIDYYLNSEQSEAMNGISTIKKIRERLPELPVIVLSARADLTKVSKSDELSSILNSSNRAGLTQAFVDGAFFYQMKDNSAPKAVKDLVRRLS